MRDSTITRRHTTPSSRRPPQPRPGRVGLFVFLLPGAHIAWRAFWQQVEHPRLVGGAALLFPTLAVLVFLSTHPAVPWSLPSSVAWSSRSASAPRPVPSPTSHSAASHVQAFYQGDPNAGWDSPAQYATWWPSACSPAALTMDLRAWGAPVQIGQVLDRLIALYAITPQQGLLHAEALATVAQSYGLHAEMFWTWTLQDVAQVTRQGVPVLVDVVDAKQQTPYPGFVVGHWLVVTGVLATAVQVADSSGYHIKTLSTTLYRLLATGIGVVLWQGTLSLPREG